MRLFRFNKKGSTLIVQTVFFFIVLFLTVIFAGALKDDPNYNEFVSTRGSYSNNPNVSVSGLLAPKVETGFFSSAPIFLNLPAWVLSAYSVLAIWGLFLVFGWVRGVS